MTQEGPSITGLVLSVFAKDTRNKRTSNCVWGRELGLGSTWGPLRVRRGHAILVLRGGWCMPAFFSFFPSSPPCQWLRHYRKRLQAAGIENKGLVEEGWLFWSCPKHIHSEPPTGNSSSPSFRLRSPHLLREGLGKQAGLVPQVFLAKGGEIKFTGQALIAALSLWEKTVWAQVEGWQNVRRGVA